MAEEETRPLFERIGLAPKSAEYVYKFVTEINIAKQHSEAVQFNLKT